MAKIAALVLAAGQGTRYGEKKQFIQFRGKELWKHIYDKVCKLIPPEDVIVVGVDVAGGSTRSMSVVNGIRELEHKNRSYERIVVLEAARPLVTEEQLKTIMMDSHSSATYVLPLTSTIIRKDGEYLNREDYFKMSTPVAFDYALFAKAYLSGKYSESNR